LTAAQAAALKSAAVFFVLVLHPIEKKVRMETVSKLQLCHCFVGYAFSQRRFWCFDTAAIEATLLMCRTASGLHGTRMDFLDLCPCGFDSTHLPPGQAAYAIAGKINPAWKILRRNRGVTRAAF
jgi:hypothetical protein